MNYNERPSDENDPHKHISHKELENMKKNCKTHRNIMELEKSYIQSTDT